MESLSRDILRGAIDLHFHSAPSVFPRYHDDLAAVDAAAAYGLAGLVLKAHEGSSAERAWLVERARPGSGAVGAVVCNHFVGGLNPLAVEVALAQGARMVWLPTIHAANHLAHYGGATYAALPSALRPRAIAPLTARDDAGALRAELIEILDLVAAAGAVLATGHLAADEVFAVVRAARERRVERVVVTHPDLAVTGLNLGAQEELARLGAHLELTALNFRPEWGGLPREQAVAQVRRIGAERFVLSSDLGQRASGEPWAGFARETVALLHAGLAEADIDLMLRANPRALLAR